MKNPIHNELNNLEPTFYHEVKRPFNFKEACLIVIGLGLAFGLIIFTALSLMFN